ncbi:MAG TPA: fasciclin domain-containing protein [Xanthomonadales bacterium]|nr:fasciclin domain-containing protein [Xanthomonadales bacterium]
MEKQEGVMVGGALMTPDKDIVDNALGSSDHTTLVAAVKAAGLVETLKGSGPFTVFAPTNAAFGKLPAGTVDTLVKPESKEKLTGILTYHVVPGALRAADLKDGMTLTTVQGQTLAVSERNGKWYVNDSLIEIADVISSNGVTHVIDSVMLPK